MIIQIVVEIQIVNTITIVGETKIAIISTILQIQENQLENFNIKTMLVGYFQ